MKSTRRRWTGGAQRFSSHTATSPSPTSAATTTQSGSSVRLLVHDGHARRVTPFVLGLTATSCLDGHDYFWALSEILDEAVDTIWICDWWLSPEIYLRRPPADNEQWRLDRVLKRAAERGVKVYVQVYKEVVASMTLNSYVEDAGPPCFRYHS